MSTTRRTVLAGLATLPAAGVPAAAIAATSPDAALIAFAAGVEALAHRHTAAVSRWCKLDSELYDMVPERPKAPPAREDFSTDVERHPDGSMTIRSIRLPADPVADRAKDEHAAALAAWGAERDATSQRLGRDGAEQLHLGLYDDLYAATAELLPMTPTTWAGLAAKARAAAALDPHDDGGLNEWEYALVSAVLRDAVRIGGAA